MILNTLIHYNQSPKVFINGAINWLSDVCRVVLVNDSYVPDLNHTSLDDVNENYIVSSMVFLSNRSINNDMMSADNVVFNNLTATFRYIIMYCDKVNAGPDLLIRPLIGYYDLGSNLIIESADYPISFSTNGIITLGRS